MRSTRRLARQLRGAVSYMRGEASYDDAPDDVAIRLAYNVLLHREPDAPGARDFARMLAARPGPPGRRDMLDWIRGSEEFARLMFSSLGPSIHFGRGCFVRTLPPARRILDLGGSSQHNPGGGLFGLGYPYEFDETVIVDLPSDERHALYRNDAGHDEVVTHLGPVRYRYHSMVDLSGLADESFDLVYSGQSIEHVTPDDADVVLKEVARVLRPGGTFALDTPNGRVCRLQQPEFIDPDHKVEYTCEELTAKLESAGFDVVSRAGLNYAGRSLSTGVFDAADTSAHWGLYADAASCYLLAFICRRP